MIIYDISIKQSVADACLLAHPHAMRYIPKLARSTKIEPVHKMQLEHLSVLPSIPIHLHLFPETLHPDDVLAAKT
jgi:hypothetical protein